MNAYEITTVVRNSRIDVDPSLDGKRVRVIILESEAEPTIASSAKPSSRFGMVGIPGVRIEFLSRDDAHAR